MVVHCWVRPFPEPVEQRLVHPGRLDRADPLGIVDQQLTVGQDRVVDSMPSQPNMADGSQTPLPQSIYRSPPS